MVLAGFGISACRSHYADHHLGSHHQVVCTLCKPSGGWKGTWQLPGGCIRKQPCRSRVTFALSLERFCCLHGQDTHKQSRCFFCALVQSMYLRLPQRFTPNASFVPTLHSSLAIRPVHSRSRASVHICSVQHRATAQIPGPEEGTKAFHLMPELAIWTLVCLM